MAEKGVQNSSYSEDETNAGPVHTMIWSKGDKCMTLWPQDGEYYPGKVKAFKNDIRGLRVALVAFDGFGSKDNEWIAVDNLQTVKSRSLETRTESQDDVCIVEPDVSLEKVGMFSPLRGDEERKRLEEKYKSLELESYDYHDSQEAGSSKSSNAGRQWRTTSKRLLDPLTPSPLSRTTSKRLLDFPTPCQSPGTTSKKHASLFGSSGSSASGKKRGIVAKGGEVRNRNTHTKTPRLTAKPADTVSIQTRKAFRTVLSSDSESEEQDTGSQIDGFADEDLVKPNFSHVSSGCKESMVLTSPGEQPVIQVPGPINQHLRDYQRDGIRFMYKHYSAGHGAILGDDMGLGKTVQVIAFIAALLGKMGTKDDVIKQRPSFIRKLSDSRKTRNMKSEAKKPFLVIGPASVLYNWVDEFDTWGHFSVGKYHRNYKEETVDDLKKGKLDVVITTFETCRDNIEEINSFQWDAVFADEAQKIKGLKAEVTKALKSLKCLRRFGLTGTPLQNRLNELWCIMDWANPGCLGSVKTFEGKFMKAIERGQKQDATKRELAESRIAQEKMAAITMKWMLRRTKDIIKEQLPDKTELVVYCKPTDLQLSVYQALVSHEDVTTYVIPQHELCPCVSGLKRGRCCYKKTPDGRNVKALTFSYMHLLLKAANHVALLLPENTNNKNQQKQATEICERAFADHPQFLHQTREASFKTLSDPKFCGKMKVLQGLLSVFRKQNSKVLLFSYSVHLLDILETYVMSMGYEYRRLDGNTNMAKRVQLVREFNRDPHIALFLISTRAGGIGLNLTGANVVIIFDPNWNPTHDLQAQDRAYRIGQSRDVKVYRLVCSGTIEENIYLRQIHKQQLGNVAVATENARRYFHQGELFGIANMFDFRVGDRCMTDDILKRNAKIETGLMEEGYTVDTWVPAPSPDQPATGKGKGVGKNSTRAPLRNAVVSVDSGVEEGRSSGGTSSDDDDDRHDGSDDGDGNDDGGSSDGGDTDHGAGFLCTQMMGMDADSPEESSSRSGRRETSVAKKPGRSVGEKESAIKNPSRKVDRLLGKGGYVSRKKAIPTIGREEMEEEEEEEEEAEEWLDDLLDLGPPASKTKRKNNIRTTQRKAQQRHENTTSTHSGEEDKVDLLDEMLEEEVEQKQLELSKSKTTTPRKKGKKSGRVTFQEQLECHDASFGSVSDVFEQCGVVHTHQNKRIIGSSKAEDHMSKCAIQDVYELHQYSQAPAMDCQPLLQSSDLSSTESEEEKEAKPVPAKKKPVPGKRGRGKQTLQPCGGPQSLSIGSMRVLIGQTPKAIRRQEFNKLMTFHKVTDKVEFARKMLFSPKEEREDILKQFYIAHNPQLDQVFAREEKPIQEECPQKNTKRAGKPKVPTAKKQISNLPGRVRRRPTRKGAYFEDVSDSEDDRGHERSERSNRLGKSLSASRQMTPKRSKRDASKRVQSSKEEEGKEYTRDETRTPAQKKVKLGNHSTDIERDKDTSAAETKTGRSTGSSSRDKSSRVKSVKPSMVRLAQTLEDGDGDDLLDDLLDVHAFAQPASIQENVQALGAVRTNRYRKRTVATTTKDSQDARNDESVIDDFILGDTPVHASGVPSSGSKVKKEPKQHFTQRGSGRSETEVKAQLFAESSKGKERGQTTSQDNEEEYGDIFDLLLLGPDKNNRPRTTSSTETRDTNETSSNNVCGESRTKKNR